MSKKKKKKKKKNRKHLYVPDKKDKHLYPGQRKKHYIHRTKKRAFVCTIERSIVQADKETLISYLP